MGFQARRNGYRPGAITRGWAVDRAMGKLMDRGISSAIIDAGGDLRVIGSRPGKEFWRIGVQHPRDQGKLLLTFDLKDIAIVTSGDYERFFIADGVRYHHILDPSSGQPARGCQSVTVLAPTATEADACATAAFVLGPAKGIAFLRARPGVRGVIVGDGGQEHWTDDAALGDETAGGCARVRPREADRARILLAAAPPAAARTRRGVFGACPRRRRAPAAGRTSRPPRPAAGPRQGAGGRPGARPGVRGAVGPRRGHGGRPRREDPRQAARRRGCAGNARAPVRAHPRGADRRGSRPRCRRPGAHQPSCAAGSR